MAAKKPRKTARKAKKSVSKPRRLTATPKMQAAAKKSAARAVRKGTTAASRRSSVKNSGKTPRRDKNKVVLHGLFLSLPSCKVGLALSMMGVPFEYRHVNLQTGEHKQPEFLAKNRWGQVPVLEHGDLALAQSNVILQYLADTFGKFAGRTPQERLRIAEWLQWDQDRMASGLGITRGLLKFFPQTHDEVVKFMRARGEQALGMLDRHLGTTKFLVGAAPTIADIAVFPWVATAEEGGFDLMRWPNVQAWAERMLAQPGAAHPYAIVPKEHRPAA